MSYETNPILNRVKIIKGWKHAIFPTKTLNYSAEMILWFKVYLFLKVYLWCQNVRLLTCDIRSSENQTKLLYLSISKHIPKAKYLKSKWKTKSFLQKLKSPLTKTKNKKARFLLYRDLRTLKHKSDFFFNRNRKKIISKAWLSKIRLSSWLNFSQSIHLQRHLHRKQYSLLWKQKKKFNYTFGKQKVSFRKSKIKWILRTVIPQNNLFWKKTQQNISGLVVKFQKDLFFLKKLFQLFPTQISRNTPTQSIRLLVLHLIQQYLVRRNFLEEIETLYEFFIKNEPEKIHTTSVKRLFAAQISKKKFHGSVRNSWLLLRKQSGNLEKQSLFFFGKKKKISLLKKGKNNIQMQKGKKKYAFTQMLKMLSSQNFRSVMLSPYIRLFKTPLKIRGINVFKLLRFEQKRNLGAYKKKEFSHFFQKAILTCKTPKIQKLYYRLSSRYNYRHQLTITTNIKLKYLIENLINKYFSLVISVKLIWPLMQFKNLKFYRLIFPAYKQSNFKKKKLPWNLTRNFHTQNKRYLYIGQNTNHLKVQDEIFRSNKKLLIYRKFDKHMINANSPQTSTKSQRQPDSTTLSNLWKKKLKKKNKYLILKTKRMQSQSENRLFWASKQAFISNLTTTLTLLTKYLDPQPFADHLAKIIGDTKKHALTLKVVKTVLKTVRFKRGLGYRIALSGRINGTNKSRTLYVKKLNQNRSRQTFSKNVNFAMSQARATIGAFGIKIWVYS